MNKFVKLLLISFSSIALLILLLFFLDFINKKYFYNTNNSITACFDNCTQYVCNAKVEDSFNFICMDDSKFSDLETANNYFEIQKEKFDNSNAKNADCFMPKPIIYKKCSNLDRASELKKRIELFLKSEVGREV